MSGAWRTQTRRAVAPRLSAADAPTSQSKQAANEAAV